MKSGGMKFWLQRGVAALGIPALIVFVIALNQSNADESDNPVRFKLSDGGGDSGKVIVIEQSPDKRDVKRVFDNGLRFKRDENGNVYRTSDFKEVAPRTIETPEAKPVPVTEPMANAGESTEDARESTPVDKPQVAKEETASLLPSLPSLDTLLPKIDFSGFEDAFDVFASENSVRPNKVPRTPGLKIKAAPVSPKPVSETKPMPEVVVEAESKPMSEAVETPKQSKSEVVVDVQPKPVPEVVQTPETPKSEIVADEVVESSPSDIASEEVEQPQPNVDSVSGLPTLADLVATDFSLPELALPELELPDLNLFFGTSSKPLIDENGEVPAEIEQQTKVEEPLESSVEDMIPMELPMEDVVVQTEESAQEEQIAEKPVTEKASNTSVFELPSIDLGLGELFGFSSSESSQDLGEDSETAKQVVVETLDRSANSEIHRVPGRRNLGPSANKAKRNTEVSNATSFNLFSEFNIPEFNNPFGFGGNSEGIPESVAKPIEVPGLKKPVVPSPDSSLLDTLPDLDSQRANVPGLKLMRSRAPKVVPMTLESSKELPKQDDKELGTGVPTAPNTKGKQEELVDPDKILDEFKES